MSGRCCCSTSPILLPIWLNTSRMASHVPPASCRSGIRKTQDRCPASSPVLGKQIDDSAGTRHPGPRSVAARLEHSWRVSARPQRSVARLHDRFSASSVPLIGCGPRWNSSQNSNSSSSRTIQPSAARSSRSFDRCGKDYTRWDTGKQ